MGAGIANLDPDSCHANANGYADPGGGIGTRRYQYYSSVRSTIGGDRCHCNYLAPPGLGKVV